MLRRAARGDCPASTRQPRGGRTSAGLLASCASRLGYGKTIEQGAATSCYVATSPLLGSTSGKYFEDCNAVTVVSQGHIHDEAMAERLWRVSQDLTAGYLVTHSGPDWNDYERAARDRARPETQED